MAYQQELNSRRSEYQCGKTRIRTKLMKRSADRAAGKTRPSVVPIKVVRIADPGSVAMYNPPSVVTRTSTRDRLKAMFTPILGVFSPGRRVSHRVTA